MAGRSMACCHVQAGHLRLLDLLQGLMKYLGEQMVVLTWLGRALYPLEPKAGYGDWTQRLNEPWLLSQGPRRSHLT
jgi:hypothetical protein